MSTVVAAPRFYTKSPGCPACDARLTGRVRLTARGRRTLLLVFIGLVFGLFTMLGGHSAASDEAGRPAQTRTVVVGEGDTLWDIASGIAEPGQTREMVNYIEELNALPGASLVQGEKLVVPVRSSR